MFMLYDTIVAWWLGCCNCGWWRCR